MRAAYDDRVTTAAGLEHRMGSARPEDRRSTWKAERGGVLVGWAFAGLDPFAGAAGRAIAGIVVHSEHRRAGIGSALWEVVSRHLDEIGATRAVANGRGDDASRSFAGRCGFTLAATHTTSMLDPPGHHPRARAARRHRRAAPERVRRRPGAGVPVRSRQHAGRARDDGHGRHDGRGVAPHDHHPDCDRELGMAAVAADDVVAVTFLSGDARDQPEARLPAVFHRAPLGARDVSRRRRRRAGANGATASIRA